MKPPQGSAGIGDLQQRHQREEFRTALRALLMQPLIGPQHESFPAIRRQADKLREWVTRETGWVLHVEREGARLYKRPADLADATRGLPNYDRRRYALLCLVASVLERGEPQITLRVLGERLLGLAAEPMFAARGFSFTLGSAVERRDLVTVCRSLLDLGILQRVAGDEESYVHGNGAQADVLYDVQRRALSGVLAAVRGPSTWPAQDAPVTLEQRLHSLVAEHVADNDEGRRTALRHHLARRLLDDPVVYLDTLDAEARAYFINQRGAMAARLCEATGLLAEQRAEGLALTDENGSLTDVAMPAEGTESHVTLLVAEYLARLPDATEGQIASHLAEARDHYGRYWRKTAREAGSERELANVAILRLEMLRLIERVPGGWVRPRPALARFALGEADVLRKPVGG